MTDSASGERVEVDPTLVDDIRAVLDSYGFGERLRERGVAQAFTALVAALTRATPNETGSPVHPDVEHIEPQWPGDQQ